MLSLVLADISLTSIVWWLFVGLIAGFLATVVMRGGGYGLILGAVIGGFLAGLVGLGSAGLIGTIIIAFIGACILIALLRMVSRRYPPARL